MAASEGGRFRKWRRRALLTLLVGVTAVALALAGAWAALQFRGTRAAILEAVAARLERIADLDARASDFSIDFTTGIIEVRDARLAAATPPGSPPFLTVPLARARLRFGSLLDGRPVFEDAEAERPHFDLDAPLPRPRKTGRTLTDVGLEVRDARVRGGSASMTEVPPQLAAWAAAARVEGIEARASLPGDRVLVSEITGRLTLEHAARPAIVAEVASHDVTVELDATVTASSIEIHGDGLDVSGSGRTAGSTHETTLAADLDAAKLFPDLTAEGALHLNGTLAVAEAPDAPTAWRGRVEARARSFPAILLQPWIEPALPQSRFDASGTSLGGTANVAFDVSGLEQLATLRIAQLEGTLDLAWTRGEAVLVATALDVRKGDAPDALRVRFDADVLPARPGARKATGELDLRTGAPLVETRFDGVRMRIDEPDPEQTAARLGFRPEIVKAWLPEGRWRAKIDLDGTVEALDASGEVIWDVDAEKMATLGAETSKAPGGGTNASVELALLPERPGLRHVSADGFVPAENFLRGLTIRRAMVGVELADAAAEIDLLSRFVALVLPRPTAEAVLGWLAQFRESGIAGPLDVEADAAGRLDALDTIVRAHWQPAPGERLTLDGSGLLSAFDLLGRSTGAVVIDLSALRLSRLLRTAEAFRALREQGPGAPSAPRPPPDVEATIDARLRAERTAAGELTLELEARAPEIELASETRVLDVHAVGRSDGERVDWSALELTLEVPPLVEGEKPLHIEARASGTSTAAWPPSTAALEIEGRTSVAGLEGWSATAALEGGTLRVERLAVGDAGQGGSLAAELPLGSLEVLVPEVGQTGLPLDAGPLGFELDALQIAPWIALAGGPAETPPPLSARLTGNLRFDPRRPAAGHGAIEVRDLVLGLEDGPVELAVGPKFELDDGRIRVTPTPLRAQAPWFENATEGELTTTVELRPDWQPGNSWTDLVRDLDLHWNGLVPASLLQIWVPGRGRGSLEVSLAAKGSLDTLVAEAALRGPTAEFRLASSTPTKLEAPEGTARAAEGVIHVEHAKVRVNGGLCDVSGTIEETGVRVDADCSGVHYRLQYGVTVSLGCSLTLRWPFEGRRRLEGDVVIERAVLRRDVDLDRELLRAVLEPELAVGLEALEEPIELDLTLTTDEGLQIKNNLADLHANWTRIEVEGTLDHPRLTGRVDIDPGGRLVLPGQTLRVDQGSLTWSGEVASEPRIELETTSSLVDPTIQQPWRSDWYDMGQLGPGQGGALDFASQQQAATTQFVAALGTGVLTHYQTRLAGSVTRSIGQTQISYAPLPLFGETDTEARFTFSQDMTRYMTFIASNDPKEAEAQTYIADVHTLPIAPSIQSQLFTNDEKNAGVTVQQRLRLGRGSAEEAGVTLRSITVAAPPEVPAKKIRRGIEYRKGDPFAEGASLDVEVDAAEALRRQGFPAADVQAEVLPVPGDKVDVHVVVEPGARTKFEFLGEKLPRPSREAVIAAYRPALEGDEESFEAMFRETRRALHAQGFLDPEVKIEVLPVSTDGTRVVRIEASGTRKIEPGPPVFEGVPSDVAVILASLFEGQLGRVELAAATTEADVFVHQSLSALGYPTPSILSRTLSDDGTRLTVALDPGPREIIDAVEVVGVPADEAELLRDAAAITPGEPARRDVIARGAAAIETRLRQRGHAQANVQFSLAPRTDRPERQLLRYRAEPGPLYRVEDVRYEGMRASRPKWVASIAGLEEGEPLQQDDVADARGRLYRTGVFRRIRVEMDPPIGAREPGEAPATAGPIDTTATFRVEEAPRYQLSYGGRWESSEGIGVVVDAIDRNSLGRGQISGVRALYARDTQSLRFYHAIPRVLGERNRLELFVEGSREIQDPNVLERSLDSWAQLTLPLTPRTQTRAYVKFSEVKLSQIEPDPLAEPLDERTASPLFGWQLVWDTSTRAIGETRRGVFAGLDFSIASKNLGSDVTSLGLYDQVKVFVPLAGEKERNPRYSWAQSWRTGFVSAQDEAVPTVDRLKLGGEYSVRGYPTDSLGPIDATTGQPLGGEFLFVVNQELHGRLFEGMSALVFFDAGNVWESPQAIEPELFQSSGLGFRYVSPIGPLRLDFAFPLDRRPDDSEYTVYFGFGNVF